MLGHHNKDLGHGSSTWHALCEHGHCELQLDFLRSLQAARQVQHSLAMRLLHGEVVNLGLLHTTRYARIDQLQVEFGALVVAGALEREQGSALWRHGHLRGECDVVVRVRGGLLEALNVVVVADHRNAAAPVLLGIVQCVVRGTGDAIAPVRSPDVHADLVVATARALLGTLVNVLARASVQAKSIPRGTSARVRSHCVLTAAHAQVVRLVDLTLVNIVACAVVAGEFVAGLAGATERAEYIDAPLVADARLLLALVHIVAGLLRGHMLSETVLALARIRSNCVHAARIRWTNGVARELALVHVLATTIRGEHEPRWAAANVPALLVLADLVGATGRLSSRTLVNVQAACAILVRAIAPRTVEQVLAAVGSVCVATPLVAATRTLATLVNIWGWGKQAVKYTWW